MKKPEKRTWPAVEPLSVRELESVYRQDGSCDEITCSSRQMAWASCPGLLKEIRALRRENAKLKKAMGGKESE